MSAEVLLKRRLVLASGSPRRKELLAQAGYRFEVCPPPPSIETDCPPGESVAATALLLAERKAQAIALHFNDAVILGADTLVECQGESIGKPRDRDDARRILSCLAGQTHQVLTGLALVDTATGRRVAHLETTVLQMAPLSAAQIESYLDSGAWEGKAGAFGYQDGWDWLTIVRGSPTNVVGLPVERLPELLSRLL